MWPAYSVDRLSARFGGQYRHPSQRLPVQRLTLSNAIRLMPATTDSSSAPLHEGPCRKALRQRSPAWSTRPAATSHPPGSMPQASTYDQGGAYRQPSQRQRQASQRPHRATNRPPGPIGSLSRLAQGGRCRQPLHQPFPASQRPHRATGPRSGSIACTSKLAPGGRLQPLSLLASTYRPPPLQRLTSWPS